MGQHVNSHLDEEATPWAEPYVARPIGAGNEVDQAVGAAVEAWGLTAARLLRVSMNAIYLARRGPDEVVLRVSRPTVGAHASLELAAVLESAGVLVPQPAFDDVVEAGGCSVTGWVPLRAVRDPVDWGDVGRQLRRLHDLDPALVPAGYPLPSPTTFPWWHFDELVASVSELLDDGAARGLRQAIDRWPDWGEMTDTVVCHGDVHPGNVMMTAGGPVLLDWDLLCLADPAWDHAPMMTWAERWGGPAGEYEALAAGYGHSYRGAPTAEAFAELRLVAATLMRVRAGRHDASARAEAERRLRYWRGDPDAPAWTAA